MDLGLYWYNVLRFGLKNTGVIYQRLVNKKFVKQIEQPMEVYVYDMLEKSQKSTSYINDLSKMFDVLQKYGMKLNPLKCSFRIASDKFKGLL